MVPHLWHDQTLRLSPTPRNRAQVIRRIPPSHPKGEGDHNSAIPAINSREERMIPTPPISPREDFFISRPQLLHSIAAADTAETLDSVRSWEDAS